MSESLSDAAVARLQRAAELPRFPGERYEALDVLGQGGMGTVWLARDTALDREVAIKVLRAVAAADLSARLAQEARILARLEHPGIVPVHDGGTLADGRAYYVMKRVRGRRLDEWRANGPSLRRQLELLQRVAEAVAFAHANGVIHRDLKPGNVMVGEFGEVLVLDWGVAKLLRQPTGRPPAVAGTDGTLEVDTGHGAVVGTRGFMAPEQERGATDVDGRADVFALGALLTWLAGEQAPKRLRAIAARASAAERKDRYPDVPALVGDLTRFLEGEPVSAYRENVLERVARLADKYRTPLLLVLAYLLMRAGLILFGGP